MTEVEDVTVILLPCAVCGRTFRPEILSKHANVCERQHTKKRKKFDSAKQRIQGTELAEFLGPPPLTNMPTKPKPPSPKKAPSRWKEKHEALIRASKDDHTKPSDHSQCPHCDRYFGPKAFDRHESWCKEQHSKIQVQNNDVTKAKKRLHARTKYRAPSFKSQRSVTKEKYSPARPPVSSTSSILPSALFEQHDRLHRQTSSVSATEVEVTSGIGGTLGRKSPGLTRQNSMPRHSRRNEEEPIKREVPGAKKQEELPTLTRISRAGSLSSQGSDNRSQGTSSSHSVGPCDTGMGSVGTPLHETKPTIKTSFSTNRKGKSDETKTESKRWKRRAEAGEQRSNPPSLLDLVSHGTGTSGGESSSRTCQKVWTRLKSNNSSSLSIGSKSKKNKCKNKKSKVISPVKSSSSRKTIILSDCENELNNLKQLNRKCEESNCYTIEDSSTIPSQSVQSELSSDNYYQISSDVVNISPENLILDDEIISSNAEDKAHDSTFIVKDPEKFDSDIVETNHTAEFSLSRFKVKEHSSENPVVVKPLSWIIPITCSSPEMNLNENYRELNSGFDKIPNDLSDVISINYDDNVANVHLTNDLDSIFNIKMSSDMTLARDLENNNKVSDSNGHGDINSCFEVDMEIDNEKLRHIAVTECCALNPNSDKSDTTFTVKTDPASKIEHTNSDPLTSCLSEAIISSCPNSNRCNVVKSLPLLCCISKGCPSETSVKSRKMRKAKPNNDLVGANICNCLATIDNIKCQLSRLYKCKCLLHVRSSEPSTFRHGKNNEDRTKFSCLLISPEVKLSLSDLSRRKIILDCGQARTETYSYSDSELNKSKKPVHRNLTRDIDFRDVREVSQDSDEASSDTFFSYRQESKRKKKKCFQHASTQTCFNKLVLNARSDSESGSVSDDRNSKKLTPFFNTEKKMDNRLRHVRRLLSRSAAEMNFNDSLDHIEEDRSTLNGSLTDGNPKSETEEIDTCVQFPENRDNEVIFTSVKRLSNTRETLNRHIAQKEWQLVQNGRFPSTETMWHQFDGTLTWKALGGGDGACILPQPTVLHLPPLSNSTPKRLNRRWSPSGGEQMVGSAVSAQDPDGALSKFCHECGGRYPVAGAKFCCLCGVRRLAI